MTSGVLLAAGPFPPANPTGRLYLSELKMPLGRRGVAGFDLSLSMRFRVVPPDEHAEQWEIQTFAYAFSLYRGEREIAAYHWEPEAIGAGAVLTPHVHFGKDLSSSSMSSEDRNLISTLASAHMPTGTVPFAALFRMVIRDFGVEPLRMQGGEDARARTEATFAEAEAVLMASFDWWNREGRVS